MKIAILFTTFIVMLLSGCSVNESQSSVIKIGYIGPLTGDAASVGLPGVAGAQTAVAEINEAGGLLGNKIVLITEDDACSSKGGINAIKKLIEVDGVVAITGPDCGTSAGAALPIAQNAKTPVVIRWASVPNLPKIGDYIFRVYPSDAFQGKFAADYLYNIMNVKKVAVLYVMNEYGVGLRDAFVTEFERLGGKVVINEGHLQEETDARSSILKVKQAEVDAIYLSAYRSDGKIFLKQIKELGLTIPVIGGDAWDSDEIILSEEAEGVLFSTAVTNNDAKFQEKVQRLTNMNATKPTTPLAYDSIYIIANAIKRAGTTESKKIKNELAKTSHKGVSYPLIEFDADGDLKAELAVYEMRVIKNKNAVNAT